MKELTERTALTRAVDEAVKHIKPIPAEHNKEGCKPEFIFTDTQLRALNAAVGLGLGTLVKKVIGALNDPRGGCVYWTDTEFALVRVLFRDFYVAAGVSADVYKQVMDLLSQDGGPGNGGSPGSNPNPPP